MISLMHSSWVFSFLAVQFQSDDLGCHICSCALNFHHLVVGVKVVVVFDATMSGLPNHKEAVNR
jgi:hypothetical protein